jgi:hypothetical protein
MPYRRELMTAVALSLVPILPSILVLIPHILSSRLTSLSPLSKAGSLGVSIICVEILRSSQTFVSQQVLLGVEQGDNSGRIRTMCEVDSIL